MEKKTKIIGAGIGLAAIAAAGAYFFAGKRGAKNRAKVADWAENMKEDVLEKMKDLKDINQEAYERLVDETADRYRKMSKASASEFKHVTSEVKKAWTHISKQLA
jgi:gas vesicle protein